LADYFATCARGLEPVLAKELAALEAQRIEPGRGGVRFAGDLAVLYRANLWLRTAVRVLQPLVEDFVPHPDALYDLVRRVDWSEWMTFDHTLAVDCNVRDSRITHSQYAARRVKDAICDQFRERTGLRPSVDTDQPMIGLNLHIHRDHAILSLDSSWHSLHKRGYRPIQTRAPLNEALAAGLLLHLGYDGTAPLVDPMCGSGTFVVEGSWIAMDRAPGLTRKWYSFYGRRDFDVKLWSRFREEARERSNRKPTWMPSGSDVRQDAVDFAHANARAAGLGHLLNFEKKELRETRPPEGCPPGLLVLNPPYGERLGEEEELIPLYRRIGEHFGTHWPGWRVAVFTSNDRLAKKINLKVLSKTPFFNGSLPCHLWEFGG